MLARLTAHPTPAMLLAAAILAVAFALADVTSADAQEPESVGDAIAEEALKQEGTWGGQCWPFVKNVVEAATGSSMGFGYHDGFIEGGATEVSLDEARRGDVIQLADPSNNGPGVSYAGLHTTIVLENYGDGSFHVVDSNSQWGEMVRVHDYDPGWSAGRYSHIEPRVYRFGGEVSGGGSTPAADPTDIPAEPTATQVPDDLEFGAGDRVRVSANGDCLNFRSGASTGDRVIRCLAHGTEATVRGEPVAADGYTWVRLETSGGEEGWVAASFLEVVEQSAPGSSDGDVSPAGEHRRVVPGLIRTP